MTKKFVRTYRQLDIAEVKKRLLIYGDLSGSCANCQAVNIKIDDRKCPQCQTEFTYISFRNVRNHLPKMLKIQETKPEITLIDHDDFKKAQASQKAEEFFK